METQNIQTSGADSITPTARGALLRAAFQDLEAEATAEGLWLRSTAEKGSGMDTRFRVRAVISGRDEFHLVRLPEKGYIRMDDSKVSFVRSGMTEEYSVSLDGVRQDFLVDEKPAGERQLVVALEVTGARATAAAYGAKLTLDGCGREIAYHRLHVTDAGGRELDARLEVSGVHEIRLIVDDRDAVYPVRIDPTFCDCDWIAMGGVPGVNGSVLAMAADGSGNLYVGGIFDQAGGVAASNVARWDGSTWSALGEGLFGQVNALAVSGSLVYAAGDFGGGVACWNGASWSPLRQGLNGVGRALAVSGGGLYVAGSFSQAGEVAAANIAHWQGGVWSALGSGANGAVTELAVNGADLYLGGAFTEAGGVTGTRGVARWNGSAWSSLGGGMDDSVDALAISGGFLYAGGAFTTAGGVASPQLARWPLGGPAWQAIGLPSSFIVSYGALAVYGGDLYFAGSFQVGSDVHSLAKWNIAGAAWSYPAATPNGQVFCFTQAGSQLCAGGHFSRIGQLGAASVACWNGSAWSARGSGFNLPVYALAHVGTDLYVGGLFTSTPGGPANHIAKWNGSTWSALGTGTDGPVLAITEWNGSIYAGGDFLTAGGLEANHVAEWDPVTSSWRRLVPPVFGTAAGTDGPVHALAASATRLFVGGSFSSASGLTYESIAAWNGASWSALGSGVPGGTVNALAVSGSDLYVGGSFLNAGGVAGTQNIARWNGSAWQSIGTSGSDGGIHALTVSGTNLYAGGVFNQMGGVPCSNIARWNGSSWSALDSGSDGAVYALAVSGTDVFAGGSFTTAGSIGAGHIAKWDAITESWSALGSGMENPVRALATGSGRLFAGGDFKTAGGKISPRLASTTIARYSDGSLDETFGVNGVVVTDYEIDPSSYIDLAIQPDGRVLVAGIEGLGFAAQYFLVRYLPNGDLDLSFGTLGKLVTDLRVGRIALQKDGKILVAGSSGPVSNLDFALARYLPNGEPDTGFGTAGMVTTDFHGGQDGASSVKVQADGKIVLAGSAYVTVHNYHVAVARFHTTGLPDLEFGTDGKVSTNFGFNSNANDVVVQPNGRIITVGNGNAGFMLVRYKANGLLDGDFGDGGKVITDISTGDNALSVALQADGRIVVAGSVTSSPWLLGLARYTNSGQLDHEFGVGGIVVNESAGALRIKSIAIQADEKILVPTFTAQGAAILRYMPNGSLDTQFGMGGEAVAGLVPGAWSCLALQADGRIAVAGQSDFDASAKTAIARYAWHPEIPTPEISVHGNNLEIASGDTTPDPADGTDLGAAPIGGFVSKGFTIRNTGRETLTLTGAPGSLVTVTPADGPFSVMAYNMFGSIPPCGGEVFFQVQFQPTRSAHAGFQTATISIASDDADENPYIFTVRACGISRAFSDGRADNSFDEDGRLTLGIGEGTADFGNAAAQQSDGKIVVAGSTDAFGDIDFLVARFLETGALDPSFGTGGFVISPIGTGPDTANAVVIQEDGRIVVAGSAVNTGNEDFAVARYLPNGTLDPAFGTGGVVTLDIGGFGDIAFALALQSDGSILVAGRSFNGSNQDFAIARLTPGGSVDATFAGGSARFNFAGGDDEAREVIVQPDGMIVLAGSAGGDFGLLRVDAYGVLDPSFGTFGKTTTDFAGGSDSGFGAVLVDENRILVCGTSGGQIALARYLGDGTLDPDFGSGGKTTAHSGVAYDVVLQPDGRIVAGAWTWSGSHSDFLLARFLENGSPDTSMDADGFLAINLTDGLPNDTARAVLVQCDGSIVLAGTSQNGIDSDLALTRHAVAPMPQIEVEGNGLTILSGDTLPSLLDHTDFGSVSIGETLTRTFTIRNTGSAALHLNGGSLVELDNPSMAPFSVSVQPVSGIIAPGGTATFQITFAPTSPLRLAAHSVTVSIASDDPYADVYTFALAAWGARFSDGTLDATFASGGKVRTDLGGNDNGISHALLPDGRILVVGSTDRNLDGGDFAILRYTPDGDLDPSFGTGGVVTTDFNGEADLAYSVTLLDDGRFVVAGLATTADDEDIAVARYYENGELDPTFGVDGKTTTDLGGNLEAAYRILLQPDGKLLVAGTTGDLAGGSDFALLRYTESGSLDPMFGSGGLVLADFNGGIDLAFGLALQADGGILVAGIAETAENSGVSDFALIRYDSTGVVDGSFGAAGKVTTDFGGDDGIYSLAIQSDGLIVAAGVASPGTGRDFALARYLANGSLDPDFGTAGKVTTDFGGNFDGGTSLAIQSDGRIVVAGLFSDGAAGDFGIARYFPSGALDPSFGGDGKVTTDFGDSFDVANFVSLQPDGRILASGFSQTEEDFDFALARYSWSDRDIVVSGNDMEISNGDTTPGEDDHTDFGSTCAVEGSVERVFTIANSGPEHLHLTGSPLVEISGIHAEDFTVSIQPSSLVAGGASTTFTITFDPSVAGLRTALVIIASDDPDENPFTFAIQGTGLTHAEVFEQKMLAAGLSGGNTAPLATPFGDGVPNLLKYAFNLNLTGPDARVLPAGGTAGLPRITLEGSGESRVLRYEFIGRVDCLELIYTAKKSTNLAPDSWLPLESVPQITPITGEWARVVYEEPAPASTTPRLFGRVEVELP